MNNGKSSIYPQSMNKIWRKLKDTSQTNRKLKGIPISLIKNCLHSWEIMDQELRFLRFCPVIWLKNKISPISKKEINEVYSWNLNIYIKQAIKSRDRQHNICMLPYRWEIGLKFPNKHGFARWFWRHGKQVNLKNCLYLENY